MSHSVFEGIEEGWQLDPAEQAGVSMVQGFVLARPEQAPVGSSAFKRGDAGASRYLRAFAPIRSAADCQPQPRPAAGQRVLGKRGG